jgi:phosphate transport system substrate-binding protein
MKKLIFAALLTVSAIASAQTKQVLAGSDTLAGAMTDAIIQSGLDQSLSYVGGGSGTGEKNLVAGDQGIAAMSREMKEEALQALRSQGNGVQAHILALDGISVFVQNGNATPSLDVATVAKIFTCELTRWEQVQGSGLKGDIHAYRRNDASGTTDAFKHFTGIKTFGACVTAVNETTDISDKTSRDVLAVGYAGLSGKVEGNRSVALAAKAGAPSVLPTTATIRNGSYPFARKLYVYEINGARKANEAELALLSYITDRSFMDPIMQAHEFITLD